MPLLFFLLVITTVSSGCQSIWKKEEPYRAPVLSMSLSGEELVHHLNSQRRGLDGWRSGSTVMWVKLPKTPPVRLEGVIACRAPQYFRLIADTLIAEADLGSNASRCWMYVRPGDPSILTWRHEETKLLYHLPTGLPYIDPNWLMMILGIKPLDSNDYEVARGPDGSQELWLWAVEDCPDGRPMRRVIKVDTVHGVVREHGVYDSEGRTIMQAKISRHRSFDGHQIPTHVKLSFPQVDAEMSLTFRGIETNPHLPDDLWKIPDKNMQVRDIGRFAREYVQRHGGASGSRPPSQSPRVRLEQPQFDPPTRSAFRSEDESVFPIRSESIEEPVWDQPASRTRQASHSVPDFEPDEEPESVPFWKRLLPFGTR